MKLKALVTLLVLGSSSLALADSYGPAVRDHRAPPVAQAFWRKPAPQLRPVLLADNAKISGWSMINVSNNRAFTKLTFSAASGKTDLDRVMITFGNGERQVVSLRGKLDGKINAGKSVTIALDGRGSRFIKSIMLVGTSGRRGSIDIVAV